LGEFFLISLLYLYSLHRCWKGTAGLGDDFTQHAIDNYWLSILSFQLRVLPAYALVLLIYSLLLFSLLSRSSILEFKGRWRRSKLLLLLTLGSGPIYLLSMGLFFRHTPGLLDGTARLLSTVAPETDLYLLYRWHILDAGALGSIMLLLWAAFFYLRGWWRLIQRAGLKGRLLLGSLALALLLSSAWFFRPPPEPPQAAETPLNVLIIGSDSLRWDRLGVHGHSRQDISPNIDALARESISLENLHVATASTLESWVSFMSSLFPPNHGVRYWFLRQEQAKAAGESLDLLPKVFNRMGYYTTVVSDWAGNVFKLVDMGFSHNLASDTQNFEAMIMEATIWNHPIFPIYFSNDLGEWMLPEMQRISKYLRPKAMADKMIDQIDQATRADLPFFGLLFFSTTHLPYTASYPFNIKYVDPEYKGKHRYKIDVTVHQLITSGFEPDMPPETIQQIKDLYDGTVSEFDHYVGQVIAALKRRGLYERTIIIVTTDHGEDLYDPGSTLGHGTNFFGGDQSTRIPFFMRVPGIQPRKVEALTRNIDLAPTLLSLLGKEPPDSWQGVDLKPLLKGEREDLELPVFAETCYLFFPKSKVYQDLSPEERENIIDTSGAKDSLEVDEAFNNNMVLRRDLHERVIQAKDRMVRTPGWKLIQIPGKREPIFRLYDMKADPGQTKDLSQAGLPVMPRLIALLERYWAGAGASQRWSAP